MRRTLLFCIIILIGTLQLPASGGNESPGGESAVKIIHAEGRTFYQKTHIHWSTEYENSSFDFIIEGSPDGYDWWVRGRVQSKGKPNNHSEYQFIDQKDDRFTRYRIRKVDENGNSEVLKEFEPVNHSIDVKLGDVCIENPQSLQVRYSFDKKQELLVRIYNRIGEQVMTKLLPAREAGTYDYALDISHLPPNNYLLVVTQVMLDRTVAEKAFKL